MQTGKMSSLPPASESSVSGGLATASPPVKAGKGHSTGLALQMYMYLLHVDVSPLRTALQPVIFQHHFCVQACLTHAVCIHLVIPTQHEPLLTAT